MEDTLGTIGCLEEKLLCLLDEHFAQGLESVNTHEAGMIIDMVKDLSEAKEKHIKACYYESMMGEGHSEIMVPEMEHHQEESRSWDKNNYSYFDFKKARDSYMETKAVSDKKKMDEKAKEYVTSFIECIKEIWDDADPQVRKQIKNDLTRIATDLTV